MKTLKIKKLTVFFFILFFLLQSQRLFCENTDLKNSPASGVDASNNKTNTKESIKMTKTDVSKHFIGTPISESGQKTLLQIARQALENGVNNLPAPIIKSLTDELKLKRGAFVTLTKNKNLRGCIGHIAGDLPLAEVVQEFAVYSALKDNRFPPVKPDELKSIKISISVMSPFKKINSPMDFIPGIHGILLKNKGRQAIFLPQVAPEQGWDRETTLVNLCRKAWLPDNAWQEDSCEFFIYTAQVFEE